MRKYRHCTCTYYSPGSVRLQLTPLGSRRLSSPLRERICRGLPPSGYCIREDNPCPTDAECNEILHLRLRNMDFKLQEATTELAQARKDAKRIEAGAKEVQEHADSRVAAAKLETKAAQDKAGAAQDKAKTFTRPRISSQSNTPVFNVDDRGQSPDRGITRQRQPRTPWAIPYPLGQQGNPHWGQASSTPKSSSTP